MSQLKPQFLRYKERLSDGSNVYMLGLAGPQEMEIRVGRRELDDTGNDVMALNGNIETIPSETLRNALLNFDKAGHIMMFEHGPVEAAPPCWVPEPMRPVEMRINPTERPDEFVATVICRCGADDKKYKFDIGTDPVIGVRWEHQFFHDMGGTTQLAKPLLDAIREFFAAGQYN